MGISLRIVKALIVVFMIIAYIRGLFIPIMNNNAAHHANIALHMYLTGDYVDLIDRGQDYLDKPHLLFWTAAFAYHLFGVTSFAYKFFSFLFVIVGVYSTFRLGKLLVDRKTGIYAALILSSSFAFILSTNDVRMDAMVVSCIAFSTWQLLEYFFHFQRSALLLGALGLALGFATKGAVAIVLPVLVVIFYFLQQQKAKAILTWRWLPLVLLTVLFLLPIFYCFYLQFDMHPEKVVRGMKGNSGILFLLFGQSFQRLTGSGWGERSSDPFFLLHTFLWAYLPWCVLAYIALFKNIGDWFRVKFRFTDTTEVALTATLTIVFTLISFSRFKNAHYVNVLFPYFAVISARYLATASPIAIRRVFWLQLVISILLMITIVALNQWAFPFKQIYSVGGATLIFVLFLMLILNKSMELSAKTVWLSFAAIAFTFWILNFNFYPQLLPYQSGHGMAKRVKEAGIDPKKLYYIDDENERNYSMEFSLPALLPVISIDSLKKLQEPIYLFAHPSQLESLRQEQVPFDTVIRASHYNVSTIKGSFLNPATRAKKLNPQFIIKVGAK